MSERRLPAGRVPTTTAFITVPYGVPSKWAIQGLQDAEVHHNGQVYEFQVGWEHEDEDNPRREEYRRRRQRSAERKRSGTTQPGPKTAEKWHVTAGSSSDKREFAASCIAEPKWMRDKDQ